MRCALVGSPGRFEPAQGQAPGSPTAIAGWHASSSAMLCVVACMQDARRWWVAVAVGGAVQGCGWAAGQPLSSRSAPQHHAARPPEAPA